MTVFQQFFVILMTFVFAATACSPEETGPDQPANTQTNKDVGTDSSDAHPDTPHPDQKDCRSITLRGECFGNTAFWCEDNELQRLECNSSAGSSCHDGVCTGIELGHACKNNYRNQCDNGLRCQDDICVPNTPGRLSIHLVGKGRITSADGAIDCPTNDCSLHASGGTKVLLTAEADPGWKFISWGDYCAGRSAATEVSVLSAANKTCTANFEQTIVNLEFVVYGGVGGKIQAPHLGITCTDRCEASVPAGQSVRLTAVPDPDYQIYQWTGCTTASGASIDFIATGDRRCTAEFHRRADFTMEVVGRGLFKTSHLGGICRSTCTMRISAEAPFRITAIPDEGARFVRWEGNCSSSTPSLMVTLPRFGPYSCRAIFEEATSHSLHVSIVGNGSVTSSPAGIDCPQSSCSATYLQNQSVMLTAHPAPDSKFVGWTNLDPTSTMACVSPYPKELVPMKDSYNCQAEFEPKLTATLAWQHLAPLNARKTVNSLAHNPQTNALYAATLDGFVHGLNASTGTSLTNFSVQQLDDSVTSLAYSPSNDTLIGASNRDIYEWSAQTGAFARPPWDAGQPLAHISLSDDDLLATSLATAGGIRLWPTRGQPYPRWLITPQRAHRLSWQPAGTLLASSSDDATLLWNTTTDTIARTFACPQNTQAHSASFSPDGLRIATTCTDILRVWNVATGEILNTFPETQASHVRWRPGTETIAAVTNDNKNIQLYDTTTGRPLLEEPLLQNDPLRSQLTGQITSILWSTDAKQLFIGLSNGTIAALDITHYYKAGHLL